MYDSVKFVLPSKSEILGQLRLIDSDDARRERLFPLIVKTVPTDTKVCGPTLISCIIAAIHVFADGEDTESALTLAMRCVPTYAAQLINDSGAWEETILHLQAIGLEVH